MAITNISAIYQHGTYGSVTRLLATFDGVEKSVTVPPANTLVPFQFPTAGIMGTFIHPITGDEVQMRAGPDYFQAVEVSARSEHVAPEFAAIAATMTDQQLAALLAPVNEPADIKAARELAEAKDAARQSLTAWETATTAAGITIEGVTLRADVDSASKYAVEIQTALAFQQNPLISDNSGRLVAVPAEKAPLWVGQYRAVFNGRRKLVEQVGDAINNATTAAEVAAALKLLEG